MKVDRTKKTLITGCNGFIGSYVLDEMIKRGYTNLCPLFGRKHLDLTNKLDVQTFFRNNEFEYCLHLSAKCGGIQSNAANPIQYFVENMEQGINVLTSAYDNNVKRFLLLSTICAYPSITDFKETSLWEGREEPTNRAYSCAKKGLQVLLESMDKMEGVTVLLGNSFGPRDNFNSDGHIIPQIIMKVNKCLETGKDLVVFGDGSPTRTFTYCEDSARGIVDMFENYDEEGPVNIGSEDEISIKETVYRICDIMGYTGNIIYDKSKPNGQMKRKLNITKAKKYGFNTKVTLNDGLASTISWYLKNKDVHNV